MHLAKDRRVIHFESALSHHLFNIPIGKLVPAVPPDAQKDERGLVVTPLEGGLVMFQEYDSRSVLGNQAGEL